MKRFLKYMFDCFLIALFFFTVVKAVLMYLKRGDRYVEVKKPYSSDEDLNKRDLYTRADPNEEVSDGKD